MFRGLPFALAPRSAERRWILVDDAVTIDLAARRRPPAAPAGPASHVVVAHFADSWRDAAGNRPPGMPVGWVLPAGEPLATYELAFADGRTRTITVRRRFEIADGIIGWGFLPFEAVGHRSDEPVDWRGPHPASPPAATRPPVTPGRSRCSPRAWGPAQTGVADFVPTPDDDITCWLHAIPLAPGELPRAPPARPAGGRTTRHGRRPGGRDRCSMARPIRSSRRRGGSSGSRGPRASSRASTSGSTIRARPPARRDGR